jgi:hypothetical protein
MNPMLRRLWRLRVLVLLVLVVIAGAVLYLLVRGGALFGGAPAGTVAPGYAVATAIARGQTAYIAEGDLTVVAFQRGVTVSGRTPRGQFVSVQLRVTNRGREPLALTATDFWLIDTEGLHYGVDVPATTALAGGGRFDLLGAPVQPGLSADGLLVFDVPPDRVLTFRINRGYTDVRLD